MCVAARREIQSCSNHRYMEDYVCIYVCMGENRKPLFFRSETVDQAFVRTVYLVPTTLTNTC